MNQESTVWIEVLEDYNDALLMTWTARPNQRDVQQVFEAIRTHLNHSSHPIHIIVDIQSNPAFPLADTLHGALKPQTHTRMGKWLVIGTNHVARIIARTISSFYNSNIEWMPDESAAYDRLSELIAEKI